MSAELPRRHKEGYLITGLRLEIATQRVLRDRIRRAVPLPEPPPQRLNELELHRFLHTLRKHIRQIRALLAAEEPPQVTRSYKEPAPYRIAISVLYQEDVIGRVDGNERIYDARGKLIFDNAANSTTTSRYNTRKRPGRRPPPNVK